MTIEERVERLERKNRKMAGGLALILIAAAAAGALGFYSNPGTDRGRIADVLTVRELHLVGEGESFIMRVEGGRLALSAGKAPFLELYQGGMSLVDEYCSENLTIGHHSQGGFIYIFGGEPSVTGHDPIVELASAFENKDGGSVVIRNGHFAELVRIGADILDNDTGSIEIKNAENDILVDVGGVFGIGSISVHDPDDRKKAAVLIPQ